MNLDIERLAITLQGVSPDMGGRVADLLGGVLTRRLSDLNLHAPSADIAHADLGTLDAPAGIDADGLTELVAARLIDWLDQEHGAAKAPRNTEGGH